MRTGLPDPVPREILNAVDLVPARRNEGCHVGRQGRPPEPDRLGPSRPRRVPRSRRRPRLNSDIQFSRSQPADVLARTLGRFRGDAETGLAEDFRESPTHDEERPARRCGAQTQEPRGRYVAIATASRGGQRNDRADAEESTRELHRCYRGRVHQKAGHGGSQVVQGAESGHAPGLGQGESRQDRLFAVLSDPDVALSCFSADYSSSIGNRWPAKAETVRRTKTRAVAVKTKTSDRGVATRVASAQRFSGTFGRIEGKACRVDPTRVHGTGWNSPEVCSKGKGFHRQEEQTGGLDRSRTRRREG